MNPAMRATTVALFLKHAALALALAPVAAPVAAHDYYTPHFQIVHPWTDPATSGAQTLSLFMDFVQIEKDDRLLAASSPVADKIVVRVPAETAMPSVPLPAGQDVVLAPEGPHLVMQGIRKDLPFGSQHPLVLVFEKAGTVEVEFVVGSD